MPQPTVTNSGGTAINWHATHHRQAFRVQFPSNTCSSASEVVTYNCNAISGPSPCR